MFKQKNRKLLLRCPISAFEKWWTVLFPLFPITFFSMFLGDINILFTVLCASLFLLVYFVFILTFTIHYDVILYEEGIEAHALIRHIYIPWEEVVQTTTLFNHTTIWVKGIFKLNIPRIAVTKRKHDEYYRAVRIIEAKVPQKAKRKVKRKNSDE